MSVKGADRGRQEVRGALVVSVAEGSPAEDAGFEAGDRVIAINGRPLRDIIDWRWHAADDEVVLDVLANDGQRCEVELERFPDEDWGLAFEGSIFDGVRTCRNACTFCFMRQLPKGVRPSLVLRDDDYRLSFLMGNFVTLTNLDDGDIERIVEQRLSPLRVSLHAIDPGARRTLMGRNAQRGMDNLERLLDAGIEVDAQIVLVPDVNDGEVLAETLEWAYAHPGVRNVGIVPLGFTRFQDDFDHGFDDPASALRILRSIEPLQQRAMAERGHAWVVAADELYRNAYGERVLEELPAPSFYGDYDMFEDGIGIIRSMVDELESVLGETAADLRAAHGHVAFICGEAMMPYFAQVLVDHGLADRIRPLPVANEWLGGNVNVTGLLSGQDVARAIAADALEADEETLYAIPDVLFNDDGLTLDDLTIDDLRACAAGESGCGSLAERIFACPPNPIDYIQRILEKLDDLPAHDDKEG